MSAYYLALEIRQTYAGMMVAIGPAYWEVFNTCSDVALAQVLKEIAHHVSLQRFRKTPRGPKKPPTQRKKYKNGEHVSTARLIAERKSR